MTRPARISRAAIVAQLKRAAQKGDRASFALATGAMRTWAYSPRYWERYLDLLTHPLARLVDLALIKQGEKIARQKGWAKPRRQPPNAPARRRVPSSSRSRSRSAPPAPTQPSLFPDLPA